MAQEWHETESRSRASHFVAAVAEFGMVLRNTKDKGSSTYDGAISRLATAGENDPDGRKAELMYLMKTARSLAEPQAKSGRR